ncbi:RlmE family RNA methyltransferase [Aquella oligotrophica]|uniref:Ribosomal RNA large subunit methyltransferase E n=1 Tax=Aquella oligotrophica TaxID=2067065 RepID=A0A2I7N4V8_9NEIS|nr:RlmE family RNA methyltransferase [Aquella oligotrophica]AUR51507.1 23S rRNA methyltransferase [Aquella oligotrophica]
MSEKPKKNKVIKAWVHQHVNDAYVNQAQKDGYRSRAAYKLLEIDRDDNLFNKAQIVVDLGCAPGSWSQVAIGKVGVNGKVIGVDLLEIDPIPRLNFIHGDFTEQETLNRLLMAIDNKEVDLVISDMAPNLSGIKNVDQARSAYLVELVLDFSASYLKVGGNCLIKVFQGSEFEDLVKLARNVFTQVIIRKPEASRSKSKEVYLLCKSKKPM